MKLRAVLAIVVCVFITGCAARIIDMTRVQYHNEAFTAVELQQGGLALLPITAGQGQEGYRRPLGDYLNQHLSDAVPGGTTMTWQAAMDSINAQDMVTVYEDIIEGYRTTSIINRMKVKELYSALGTRYALYCALQDYTEDSKTSYNLFSGWNTTKTANVSAQCLVMDLVTGDIVQEVIGQAQSVAGDMQYNSPYEAYAESIAKSVLYQLPGSAVVVVDATARESSTNNADSDEEW